MSRYIVHLLPFLLPFLLYGLYLWHAKRTGRNSPEATPWFWLAGAGLLLVILGFLIWGGFFLNETGSYTPARFENGRIVPGRVEP